MELAGSIVVICLQRQALSFLLRSAKCSKCAHLVHHANLHSDKFAQVSRNKMRGHT